jgi:hypothetical protein
MLVIYGNPKMNIYYVAAKETMQAGLLTRIMAYAGNANFSRANLARQGRRCQRKKDIIR